MLEIITTPVQFLQIMKVLNVCNWEKKSVSNSILVQVLKGLFVSNGWGGHASDKYITMFNTPKKSIAWICFTCWWRVWYQRKFYFYHAEFRITAFTKSKRAVRRNRCWISKKNWNSLSGSLDYCMINVKYFSMPFHSDL